MARRRADPSSRLDPIGALYEGAVIGLYRAAEDARTWEVIVALFGAVLGGSVPEDGIPGSVAPVASFLEEVGRLGAPDSRKPWLERFRVHMDIAARVRRQSADASLHLWARHVALDKIDHPIAIADARARVLVSNRAFQRWVDERAPIRLSGGRVVARRPAGQSVLDKAFCDAAIPERARQTFCFPPVAGTDSSVTSRLLISRVADDSHHHPLLPERLLTLVGLDHEANGPLNPALLHSLYELTPAETKVADALIRGATVSEIAARGSVSVHTVRSQVKSLMRKTGTRRQGELVGMLLALPRLVWEGAGEASASKRRQRGEE